MPSIFIIPVSPVSSIKLQCVCYSEIRSIDLYLKIGILFILSYFHMRAVCYCMLSKQERGKKPTYYSFILTHFYYWFRVGNGAKPSKHWAKYWTEGKKIPWLAVIELGQYSPTGKEEINFLPVYCNISHNNSKPIVAH